MSGSQAPKSAIVVGAGMVGLATAWHLQERDIDVTVLDRAGVAAGSSWGNAGWLTPALTMPIAAPSVLAYGLKALADPASPIYVPLRPNRDLLRFLAGFTRHCTPARWRDAMSVFAVVNRMSLDAYDELAHGGVDVQPKPADPFIAAFATDADRDDLVKEFAHTTELGAVVDHDLIDGDALKRLEPSLAAGVTSGLVIKGQRFINPGDFVNSLAAAVRSRGAEIVGDALVTRVDDRRAGVVSVHASDGRIWSADTLVLATGTWLGKLARQFGVKRVVQAGRGYSFSVRPENPVQHPVYFPAQRVACTPLGDDRLRVAGMMEFRPPGAPLDPRRVQAIVNAVTPMFSGIDWEARTAEWVGSRPCTADGLPLIGRTRSRRVFVAGGHGMWGIALGPLTGRFIADEVIGAPRPDILDRFDPLR